MCDSDADSGVIVIIFDVHYFGNCHLGLFFLPYLSGLEVKTNPVADVFVYPEGFLTMN